MFGGISNENPVPKFGFELAEGLLDVRARIWEGADGVRKVASPPSAAARVAAGLPREGPLSRSRSGCERAVHLGRQGRQQPNDAGGDKYPIHFTNVIYDGNLYTLTYKWPGVARRPCTAVGAFSLDDFNKFMEASRYVGAETLDADKPRRVHHFRAGVVWEPPPEVLPPDIITPVGGIPETDDTNARLRMPIMLGDFYVDQKDPSTFWQVLHFGMQNLYDPDLDEWIVMKTFSKAPGKVTLPDECESLPPPTSPGGS